MSEEIQNIIDYEDEGAKIDFKLEQYAIDKKAFKKSEVLKDISAMANLPSNEDKYIVIGIKKKNGKIEQQNGIESLHDQAIYQQYLNDNIEPEIQFEYKQAAYDGKNISYFRIYGNTDRPYLFKKEVKSLDGKTLYKEGDGYIRTGSATRKMVRSDFERIYESKYLHPDRKNDISIIPYIVQYRSNEIDMEGLWCLDIAIENKSKKSIGLDVEMKVYKSSEFSLISEPDLKDKIYEMEQERKQHDPFRIAGTMPPIHLNLFVSCNEHDDFIIIERHPSRMEKTAISLPQEKTENDVFSRQLIILAEKPASIQAEIIIRSDDFQDGAIIEKIYMEPVSWHSS
ncbi:hypothetical protein GCM10011386_27050 [Parapedobacter defluvii]|uniref:Schlafen AlbA-2 domain-containing protein n=1 Tax=Parapedobacter defluvii TaxID=2045106 RepID=A0ABQ1M1R9_9SPHI|nr:ATP-binding protein [Parapedobacter defluvii]GGC33529.1 hypothetical protein GCM10011386_27050 [Parapedobacter defluvii]